MKILKHLLLLVFYSGFAQNGLLNNNTTTQFKDFTWIKRTIYAITENNDLVSINIDNNAVDTICTNTSCLAKKSNNDVLFGSKDGKIYKLKRNRKIKLIDSIDAELFSIFIDSKDKYVVYSNKSIYYKKRHYIPKLKTNFYGYVRAKYTGTKLVEPDYIYLDKMNFIWFAYDEGEWGGRVCFFDLNKKEFIYEDRLGLDDHNVKYKDRNEYDKKLIETHPDKIKVTKRDTIYKYPYCLHISSSMKGAAYNSQNNLFITSSGGGYGWKNMAGFSYYVDGSLVKVSEKEKGNYKSCFDGNILVEEKYRLAFIRKNVLDYKKNSEEYEVQRKLREDVLTENKINILGSITYNPFDKNLYFYCTKGFYLLKNTDCTFKKELIFTPNLTCKFDYEEKYCEHLNVTKFEFISEKEVLFLTKNNGIGYFDGKSINEISELKLDSIIKLKEDKK